MEKKKEKKKLVLLGIGDRQQQCKLPLKTPIQTNFNATQVAMTTQMTRTLKQTNTLLKLQNNLLAK